MVGGVTKSEERRQAKRSGWNVHGRFGSGGRRHRRSSWGCLWQLRNVEFKRRKMITVSEAVFPFPSLYMTKTPTFFPQLFCLCSQVSTIGIVD